MDPLVWSVIFGFPVTLATPGCTCPPKLRPRPRSFCSRSHSILFRVPSCLEVIQPVPYFWTVCTVLMVLNLAWVPLTHSAVSQVRKTIAWTFVVVAHPSRLPPASFAVTPTSNIGDNVCLACVSVATTCLCTPTSCTCPFAPRKLSSVSVNLSRQRVSLVVGRHLAVRTVLYEDPKRHDREH